MPDKIINSRAVFFVSDSTGITVETLGHSLLSQFNTIEFNAVSLRFVDTEEKAREAQRTINKLAEESSHPPLIFCTLVKPELRQLLSDSKGLFFDVLNTFLKPIEDEMGIKAKHDIGRAHGILDDHEYANRISAVSYSLKTDDGSHARIYDDADVIITGVSRTGKTATCLYLALHYGLYAANYPLVENELEAETLPQNLLQQREKIIGFYIMPERLHLIRTKRRPDSEYASLSRCRFETRQAESMFNLAQIPFLDVSSMSIEEIASTIVSMLSLTPRTFVP